jgi:hypothetical protein
MMSENVSPGLKPRIKPRDGYSRRERAKMKKLALALALALAISPLTFAQMHKKGKHVKKSARIEWRPGPNGTSLYKQTR